MIADKRFLNQSKDFWAHVRSISEGVGYTVRGQGTVKVPSIPDIVRVLGALDLKTDHIAVNDAATDYGNLTPRSLTTVTRDGKPLRTLARWVDGAFPDTVNPIAVWEVKDTITPRRSAAAFRARSTKRCWTVWNLKNCG